MNQDHDLKVRNYDLVDRDWRAGVAPEREVRGEDQNDGMHPTQAPIEPEDAGTLRSALHPVATPPPWRNANDPQARIRAVEEFCGRIGEIVEREYGDWMRRANVYWMQLVEALKPANGVLDEDTTSLLDELHFIIQYQPNFMIVETQRQVIEMALELRQSLGAANNLDVHDFGVSVSERTTEPPVPSYSVRFANSDTADIGEYFDNGQGQPNEASLNVFQH